MDRYQLVPYLQGRLRPYGWEFPSVEGAQSSLERLSQTLFCGLGYGNRRVDLSCVDYSYRDVLSLDGAGLAAFTQKAEFEAAVREVVENIEARRSGGFDVGSALQIKVERHSLTESELDERIASRELGHRVEGVWSVPDGAGGAYRLGVTRGDQPGEFLAIVFDSPDNSLWEPGMVKARLTETADGRTFVVSYRIASYAKLSGTGMLGDVDLQVVLPDGNEDRVVDWLKLRPSVAAAANSDGLNSTASSPVSVSGTAFVVHPDGLLLTANHVVDGATSIEVSCNGQSNRSAIVRSSSASTDLALLSVSIDPGAWSFLPLSQRGVSLGDKVFTVGYPLIGLLGEEPKYTEGTVSALTGPGGDASFLQISVPIQPGNSGGPLVDEKGAVVGVVIATASAPAFFQVSGTLPQNINWAVKGLFAAALFNPPNEVQLTDDEPDPVIDRVREATCLVVAER